MNNALDAQFERLDLDRAGLDKVNPGIIGVQLSAHKAEKPGPRDDYPGYDPVIQAIVVAAVAVPLHGIVHLTASVPDEGAPGE